MESALIAFGGVVLGWLLGAGTQIMRDRRQARAALVFVQNELLGNAAQLDLAQRQRAGDEELRPSRWLRRWRLSRTAWESHGAVALTLLSPAEAQKVQDAYHALDAAQITLEEAREGVLAVKGMDLSAAENTAAVAEIAAADRASREKLALHAAAALDAAEMISGKLLN